MRRFAYCVEYAGRRTVSTIEAVSLTEALRRIRWFHGPEARVIYCY